VPWTMIPVIKLYQLFPGLVEWGMVKAMPNRGPVNPVSQAKPESQVKSESKEK